MQSYQKLSTKTCLFWCPLQRHESGFSSLLHLKNKYQNRLNPSNDLWVARVTVCQGMSGHFRKSSNKKAISFDHQDVIQITIKIRKLKSATECFLLCCVVSRPTYYQ